MTIGTEAEPFGTTGAWQRCDGNLLLFGSSETGLQLETVAPEAPPDAGAPGPDGGPDGSTGQVNSAGSLTLPLLDDASATAQEGPFAVPVGMNRDGSIVAVEAVNGRVWVLRVLAAR